MTIPNATSNNIIYCYYSLNALVISFIDDTTTVITHIATTTTPTVVTAIIIFLFLVFVLHTFFYEVFYLWTERKEGFSLKDIEY